MTRRRQGLWLVYVVAGLLGLSTFAVIGVRIDALEQDRDRARTLATHRDRLRLAVWRMDAWLSALLAPEAARPPTDYDSPSLRSLRRATGDLGAPALTAFRSEWLSLHFSIGAAGRLRSPQLVADTTSNEARRIAAELGDASELWDRLEALRPFLTSDDLRSQFGTASAQVANRVDFGDLVDPANPWFDADVSSPATGALDLRARIQQSIQTRAQQEQQLAYQNVSATGLRVGPLVPLWLDQDGQTRLTYVRQVTWNGREVLQGFAVDWPRLRRELVRQVEDLFPTAQIDLRRASETPDSDRRSTLATAPLTLVVPEPDIAIHSWSTTRTVLTSAWSALLLGFLAIGFTMKRALDLGHRETQFASAVTHELRSPLTTFRMYAEMLDEGMVQGEEKRAEYLRTLRQESDRLGQLVESVLVQTRIERGQDRRAIRSISVQELAERVVPTLERLAERADRPLEVEFEDRERTIETDPDAVEQILTCLVDNACRHGRSETDPTLRLRIAVRGDRLDLTLRDHGPGIPKERRRAIFRTFERGAKHRAVHVNDLPDPGLGLGLAIARGLAKSLGGRLQLDQATTDGAAFALSIPLQGGR